MATKKRSRKKTSTKSPSTGPSKGAALQSAIRSAGHTWTAGPTPLSELSVNEQVAHLGLVVSQDELRATAKAIMAAEQVKAYSASFAAPPPAVDWRNKGGNWITSVKDQQSCGSCVSFATLGTLEARLNIVCNDQNLDVDLSEAHLFYCGCGSCCDTGWNFPPALDFCKNTGVGLESSFPYTPGNQPCKAGVPIYVKIDNWTSVLPIVDRKNILATKGPMVAGMAVFQDFMSYTSGVYHHVSGSLLGYHAISVVGYDDAQKCWICKNSWNATWGESGFFRIGYGECSIDTQFAFYDIDVKCTRPTPTDDCASYVPALRRVLIAARTNSSLRACLRYYVCGRGRRPHCSDAILRVVKAVILILRRCPQYRRPFCQALG
jgi:C1A family cysteine protease